MKPKILASCVLAVCAAASAQDKVPTFSSEVNAVNLNGGLKAELLSLARDPLGYYGSRPLLTAAVKITNPGKDYAFLLLYDNPSAVDDAGISFIGMLADAVAGVEWCRNDPPERCFGIGNPAVAVPVDSYTEIEPGNAITVHLRLTTSATASQGKTMSLTVKYGLRIVKQADMEKDADVSAGQKVRQVRRSSMSFPPSLVTER
jgi:hypothetical protein